MFAKSFSPSCLHTTSLRNTRIALKPRLCAQPSSRSITSGLNVSVLHISIWLIAFDGMKFAPA